MTKSYLIFGSLTEDFGHLLLDEMTYLIDFARQKNIGEINLKVDAENSRAKALYDKFGFDVIEHSPNRFYIMRRMIT